MMSQSTGIRPIRVLPASAEFANLQLAGSPALLAGLEQTARPALRWYQISQPALLLGSSQPPAVADLAACAAAGVTLHRRRSGGGAVLADLSLLLLDLALPPADPLYQHDVTESYRWFGEVWAAALQALGLEAHIIPNAEARTDARALDQLLKDVCFGGRSPYEVMVGRRKVVGLAQIRRRSGTLFQAGVYLHWSPDRTATLMAATAAERIVLADRLAERVAGLSAILTSESCAIGSVKQAVELSLKQLADLTPSYDTWNASEQAARQDVAPLYAALQS